MRFSTALAAVAPLAAVVSAIDTVVLSNRHLAFNSTGKPFWIKGVDYQPGGSSVFKAGSDPLSNANDCARDIYLFQQLGINTIRVYSVDPTVNHDECMTLLASAGIYLILDVNTPIDGQHLNNQEPWTTYTPQYLQHIFSVIEVFSGYDNTLAFLAGNEVIFDTTSAKTSPNYVKAVVRDMKGYLTNHVARNIPVGYSNADDLRFRTSLAAYLQCGNVGYIDFFGVNSYQWCGKQTFQSAGYDQLVDAYQNYSLPVFFTEYGCNKSPPRLFEEVGAMFSDQMTGVFSGGLAYEYTQETNDFGLVKISSSGDAQTIADYKTLQGQFSKVDVDTLAIPSSAKNNTRPTTCPAEGDPVYDNITANLTLPTTLGQDMINNGLPSSANVTRGKFVTLKTKATTNKITLNGASVSDPTIKSTDSTNDPPLPSGGTGINTGGGVGKGGSTTDSTSGGSGNGTSHSGSAMVASRPVFAIISSLVSVALVFGVFL
jgi:hypothetical protein